MHKYLYRGVNAERDKSNCCELRPLAYEVEFKRKAVYGGGGSHYSDGSVFGESERNAIVQHQKDSSKFITSGISTTPHFHIAEIYAKGRNGNKKGFVYRLDTSLLKDLGVKYIPVGEHVTRPSKPEDEEVILVAAGFGSIPDAVIVEKIEAT